MVVDAQIYAYTSTAPLFDVVNRADALAACKRVFDRDGHRTQLLLIEPRIPLLPGYLSMGN